MIIIPRCFDCRHLDRGRRGMSCAAFPGGIPDAIALSRRDHTRPYPGDRGIRFEPDDRPAPPPPETGAPDPIFGV